MTEEKYKRSISLHEEINYRKDKLKFLEAYAYRNYEPRLVMGGDKVCVLTHIELQMIKKRLQMELDELVKEFEAL